MKKHITDEIVTQMRLLRIGFVDTPHGCNDELSFGNDRIEDLIMNTKKLAVSSVPFKAGCKVDKTQRRNKKFNKKPTNFIQKWKNTKQTVTTEAHLKCEIIPMIRTLLKQDQFDFIHRISIPTQNQSSPSHAIVLYSPNSIPEAINKEIELRKYLRSIHELLENQKKESVNSEEIIEEDILYTNDLYQDQPNYLF